MRQASRWWRNQSSTDRFDLATRWALYLMSATAPGYTLSLSQQPTDARALPLVVFQVLVVLHTAACLSLLHTGLRGLADARRPRRWQLVTAGALTAAGLLAGAAALPGALEVPADGIPLGVSLLFLFGGGLTMALTPWLSNLTTAGAVALGALGATALLVALDAPPGETPLTGAAYLGYVGFLAFTYRFSIWMLVIVLELDRSRAVHARLAVAEERLRFSRDLHDVLGGNLALIVVQSELAARLAHRGADGAAEQMYEVRRVAQESLREMREVVSGYREADLDTELAGARSLLRSAGVDVRVIGGATALPHSAQAALGWVVREATTNVIRHSDASRCTISLDELRGPGATRTVVLRIENDGVRGAAEHRVGTGLAGLTERLGELGGELSTESTGGGRFVVTARVPKTGHRATAVAQR